MKSVSGATWKSESIHERFILKESKAKWVTKKRIIHVTSV